MVPMVTALLGMAVMASVMGSVGADRRPLEGSLEGSHLVLKVDGTTCEGDLVQMGRVGSMVTGLGSVRCSDGRRGSFNWSSDGPGSASADGRLDGEPLELTFTQG